ncbi:hypothetical protein AALP_AA4G109100 [Arabis alpina]|uniref:Uncharacterized protein n=1 Tax=Arabis alpina TaxID=50452 RepID=A0A087H2I1_ARAAL|nr:hypothetical protein AALP_AA4G109100 [Arabis alpina]
MAPLEDPPGDSSSDEGETESVEEEEANDVIEISSDSESSDSESETETDTVVVQPSVVSSSRRTKQPRVEETSTRMQTKRAKTDDEKKPYSQMLIEEDEIVILQGAIDFKLDKGKSFYQDQNEFYDFVKRSLNIDLSPHQLTEKVRSLNMKYIKGVEPTFLDAHDQKCFELAKVIDGLALELEKSEKIYEEDWFDKSYLVRAIASFGVSEDLVKQRWSMVAMETKKIIEDKWRELQAKEIEFMMLKTNFLCEVTSAMAKTLNP